ncbi:ROK family protein [Candidatus Poribacteria bacterium]|nr:ROK family protein [Candidatus Poribacteria bacterium]
MPECDSLRRQISAGRKWQIVPVYDLWETFRRMASENPSDFYEVNLAFHKPGVGAYKRRIPIPLKSFRFMNLEIDPSFALATFINNRAVALGAGQVWIDCPREIFRKLKDMFEGGTSSGGFGYLPEFMESIYGEPFILMMSHREEINSLPDPSLPKLRTKLRKGGFLGIDLGRSDVKVAYIRNGRFVEGFKKRWAPEKFSSIEMHLNFVLTAAEELMSWLGEPPLAGVGLSTAGVVYEGRIRISGLFSGITDVEKIPLFGEILSMRLRGKPVHVIHDGDAAMLQARVDGRYRGGILGISMGSGVGFGCVNSKGELEGLNETGKAVLDLNPNAPIHRNYRFRGAAIFYLSQNAAFRMAEELGMRLDEPARRAIFLEEIKDKAAKGERGFREIPLKIGEYLGLSVPEFLDIYSDSDIRHIVLYGRVVSGRFGQIIIGRAREILKKRRPEIADEVELGFPMGTPEGMDGETNAELGQAVAAAYYAALSG